MNVFAADAATRTARLRTLRRAVALSAAALAVVGLSACGGDKTATPPTAASSAAPAAVTSAAPVSSDAATLAGTRYYLGTSGKEASIHAVQGDTDKVTARIPFGSGSCTENTITVSPDGKRIAWVQNGDDTGTLMTAAIDGSQRRTLEKGVSCLGSRALVWQGDDWLMVQQRNRSVLMDLVAGGPHHGDPGEETDRYWSADGKWLAAVDDYGKPFVTGGKGGRKYSYTPPKAEAGKHDGWQARGVSMDGRYVAVGWKGTDPSRQDGSFAVVDTTTSKVVDLPGAGEVRSILFTADGKVIVRRATGITVLDSTFKPLGTVEEPTDVRGLTLLAYAA
ncbi:TolB-like translocation protein [Micromonospora inositola]|uniref:WD40-like Beta Propeller Repeat n=1 Tax=Micromonospora inositola TaxID=47865 RepID=A0A1C5HUS7_9ACTN|nr:PD40 domain-containing protein [Micromonospora inositola]SCG49643.1 WD40-like Beta Propeller Repeat [Micromonospora inositola]